MHTRLNVARTPANSEFRKRRTQKLLLTCESRRWRATHRAKVLSRSSFIKSENINFPASITPRRLGLREPWHSQKFKSRRFVSTKLRSIGASLQKSQLETPAKNIVKEALFVPDSADRDPPLPNVGQKAMNLIREGLSTLL